MELQWILCHVSSGIPNYRRNHFHINCWTNNQNYKIFCGRCYDFVPCISKERLDPFNSVHFIFIALIPVFFSFFGWKGKRENSSGWRKSFQDVNKYCRSNTVLRKLWTTENRLREETYENDSLKCNQNFSK